MFPFHKTGSAARIRGDEPVWGKIGPSLVSVRHPRADRGEGWDDPRPRGSDPIPSTNADTPGRDDNRPGFAAALAPVPARRRFEEDSGQRVAGLAQLEFV